MTDAKKDIGFWILDALEGTDGPQGAGWLLEEIAREGIDVSEATIGRLLRKFRASGWLERVSNLGHQITQSGREHLAKLRNERNLGTTLKAFLQQSKTDGFNNILDVLTARKALEREAVWQATVNATDAELAEIEKIVRAQYDCIKRGIDYSDLSSLFHKAIFKASHAPLLETLYNFIGISTAWQSFFIGTFMMYDVPTNLQHDRILQAMKARNPREAAERMASHIEDVIANARKISSE